MDRMLYQVVLKNSADPLSERVEVNRWLFLEVKNVFSRITKEKYPDFDCKEIRRFCLDETDYKEFVRYRTFTEKALNSRKTRKKERF